MVWFEYLFNESHFLGTSKNGMSLEIATKLSNPKHTTTFRRDPQPQSQYKKVLYSISEPSHTTLLPKLKYLKNDGTMWAAHKSGPHDWLCATNSIVKSSAS